MLVELINSMVGEEQQFTPESVVSTPQKVISNYIDLHTQVQLHEVLGEERDKARVNSVGMQRAGDLLNAAPIKSLGLHLRAKEFTVAVKYRLGIRVFPTEGPCVACGQESDVYGDHTIGCSYEGERIYRHNVLRNALYDTCKQASLAPAKEQSALIPGSQARPADIYLPGLADGRDTALDVCVVSPLQILYRNKAAEEAGSAVECRHRDKMKYYHACDGEGIHFAPLAAHRT